MCVYIHVYQIIKNRRPGPCNSLRHAEIRKYFSALSLTQNRREAHMIYMAREVWKIWRRSCWEKGTLVMIYELKYGQTWKIWPFPLSLSLYSTFKNKFFLMPLSCEIWEIFYRWTSSGNFFWVTVTREQV